MADGINMQQKDPMGRLCVVADDNAEVRAEICQRIRLSGMFERVKSFESLEDALCFIRHTEVDLFISDICFPDEELSFRRLSEIPTVPVMLISAYELYFIVHYLDIRENMNMIGLLHKPLTDDFEANVRASFSRYKGLGLDQSVVLERSRNEKLILCQGERQLKRYEVKYSEIVLVQACRKPRGLQVYIKAISTPFYLTPGQLKPFFAMVDRVCPGLFYFVPHTCVVNLANIQLQGNYVASIVDGCTGRTRIPSTEQKRLWMAATRWTKGQ